MAAIVEACELSGYIAFATGQRRADLGGSTPSLPDVIVTRETWPAAVGRLYEVKVPGERARRKRYPRKRGGYYFSQADLEQMRRIVVVSDPETVLQDLRDFERSLIS